MPRLFGMGILTTKTKPKGWKQESVRHSLARKGIKTGKKKKLGFNPKKKINVMDFMFNKFAKYQAKDLRMKGYNTKLRPLSKTTNLAGFKFKSPAHWRLQWQGKV